MDEFLVEMAEILEEDSVGPSDELNSFAVWDSLAVLSVAALADDKFGVKMSAQEINAANTMQELFDQITAKKSA